MKALCCSKYIYYREAAWNDFCNRLSRNNI